MKLDREIRKKIWFVHRMNRGQWEEIYHTPDETKARAEAEKMQSWDARTKVSSKTITFIVNENGM